jgi:hypothetical protein
MCGMGSWEMRLVHISTKVILSVPAVSPQQPSTVVRKGSTCGINMIKHIREDGQVWANQYTGLQYYQILRLLIFSVDLLKNNVYEQQQENPNHLRHLTNSMQNNHV